MSSHSGLREFHDWLKSTNWGRCSKHNCAMCNRPPAGFTPPLTMQRPQFVFPSKRHV